MPPPTRTRWALITGATPGSIAEAEAQEFLKRGINVVATRSIEISTKKEEEEEEDILLEHATSHIYTTPLLDTDLPTARKSYEVNIFGLISMTQAFFPMLRAAKGMVVNHAVWNSGLLHVPYMGVGGFEFESYAEA
ncbi:hypothetical protein AC578_3838 [Pseudocercospora eumusae]|uniref:Uncharacterized protein n=1 Tax=Pseudocercospora eumusae TaxID=321146 RepID=A0A139GXN6_9PEZI|nr:hypothetical protein AC578_3838 [Pseudocercospora eumusae]